MPLSVVSVFDLAPTVERANVEEPILEGHRRFLGEKPFPLSERREEGRFSFADAVEPDLEQRWRSFDAQYRAVPRYRDFWIAELEDAVVHPPFGIVTVGDRIVRETVRDSSQLASTFPPLDREQARRALRNGVLPPEISLAPVGRSHDDHCFLLGWGLPNNYFNWTLRYLSRVMIHQSGARDLPLLVPAVTVDFMRRTLEFYRVRQPAVRELQGPTRVRRLTITAPGALGRYELSPILPRTLREHLAVRQVWREPPGAIYVPRGSVKMRRVVNEEVVASSLAARGIRRFDPGTQPMLEQVRAFGSARLIVAAHGAALTNIVYSRPGTTVVEIVPEGYDQGVTSYRSLADLFGLEYRQMFAREVVVDRKGNRCNSDISISVPHLAELLDGIA